MSVTVFGSSSGITVRSEGRTFVGSTLPRALTGLIQDRSGVQLGADTTLLMEESIARRRKTRQAQRTLDTRGTAVLRIDPLVTNWVRTQALVEAISFSGVEV